MSPKGATKTRYLVGMLPSDYLPISKINTVIFCSRRYYLEHVLGETRSNHHIAEGNALHERARRGGAGVWVWSDRLGIVGIVDQLDYKGEQPVVTEFKKGWLGDHHSDQVQLCALALCLEEMKGCATSYGYIFYHRTRRKQRVDFTPELRNAVEEAVKTMREVGVPSVPPPVIDNRNKCRGCSVQEVCQPTLTRRS